MRAELHLARRYLFGLRRRTHVATVTLISLVSLGLGVLALIVTLALLEGFQSSIRADLVARAAHARLRPTQGRVLEAPDRLASLLQARLGGVEMVQVVRGTCLVSTAVDAVPASVEGRSDVVGVAIDHVLSARLATAAGDVVQVISPRQRLTPMGPLPVRLNVDVTGVVPPALGDETGKVMLPLADAQRLLWGRPVVEVIELRDSGDAWGLGRRVRQALAEEGGVAVDGLEMLHKPLLMALALERIMIFVAVGLMLVVAAVNLLCNVAMVAAEKRTDLAVLAGLGLAPRALRRMFLLLGVAIGAVGATVGAILGVLISVVLDATHALPLPRGVFAVASVPFKVEPQAVALVMVSALLLATAASWLPARLVARREPAEGLRYE